MIQRKKSSVFSSVPFVITMAIISPGILACFIEGIITEKKKEEFRRLKTIETTLIHEEFIHSGGGLFGSLAEYTMKLRLLDNTTTEFTYLGNWAVEMERKYNVGDIVKYKPGYIPGETEDDVGRNVGPYVKEQRKNAR